MNLLTLSDDEARSLGLNVTRLRFGLIVCATLITASTVAIAGIIGWVGTVVPHIARLLTGHNHQQLLPMAMCTGAILLLLTDTLARSIGTTEIPLGILTAFVGAPFFLFCCYAEVASDFACRPSCVSGLLPPSGATRRVLHPVARNNLLSVRSQWLRQNHTHALHSWRYTVIKGEILLDSLPVQTLSHRQRAQAIAGAAGARRHFAFSVLDMVLMGLAPTIGAFPFPVSKNA